MLFSRLLMAVSVIGFVFTLALEIEEDIARIVLIVLCVLFIIGLSFHQYFKSSRSPMLSTKGIVKQKRVEYKAPMIPIAYKAKITLPSGKNIWLNISKKQHKALLENDIIDLVYKGGNCVSIKGSADKSPMINTDYYPANTDISKLMKMNAHKINKRAK